MAVRHVTASRPGVLHARAPAESFYDGGMRASLLVFVTACSVDPIAEVAPLAPLPPPQPVATDRFLDAEACGQCHLVPDGAPQLRDADGGNVSPVKLWRSSMMALAARDPFYLAVFAEELERAPERRATIEATCTRCHAPAGSEQLATEGAHLGFDELTAGSSPAALLGRGGVTCTLCHQIDAANLGSERSFTGGFTVGFQRLIYGPYLDPRTSPMELIVDYRPTGGAHITSAELCGSCHTVIVPGPSGDIVEQATYLEWRSSSFAATTPCQSCHVPTVDDLGRAIVTPVASFPDDLLPRPRVGRHTFVGANAYMLSLLADNADWVGAGVSADELRASAAASEAHLATAAKLAITRTAADAFAVRVDNQTGHKLPTGYPSRRMWLRVEVRVGGATVFASGLVDDRGAIVDAAGAPIEVQPHRDEIGSDREVQIWEAELVDVRGEPTHRAMDASRYRKDDRILPAGFAPAPVDVARTEAIGVINDSTFVPGSDAVTFRVPALAPGAEIAVELLYQSVTPRVLDAVEATKTPASVRFIGQTKQRSITPIVMARTTLTW